MRSDFFNCDPNFGESFHTLCSAFISENGFMTNAQEVQFLKSIADLQTFTNLHVDSICTYLAI